MLAATPDKLFTFQTVGAVGGELTDVGGMAGSGGDGMTAGEDGIGAVGCGSVSMVILCLRKPGL